MSPNGNSIQLLAGSKWDDPLSISNPNLSPKQEIRCFFSLFQRESSCFQGFPPLAVGIQLSSNTQALLVAIPGDRASNRCHHEALFESLGVALRVASANRAGVGHGRGEGEGREMRRCGSSETSIWWWIVVNLEGGLFMIIIFRWMLVISGTVELWYWVAWSFWQTRIFGGLFCFSIFL